MNATLTELRRQIGRLLSAVLHRNKSVKLTQDGKTVAQITPRPQPLTPQEFSKLWRQRPKLDKATADQIADNIRESRTRNRVTLVLIVVLFVSCVSPSATVVELPRPNSGTFTFAQAEARKLDIYSLAQSRMKTDWKNPYMGFSVHITRDDEVVVYDSRPPYAGVGGKTGIAQLENVVGYYPLNGNRLGY